MPRAAVDVAVTRRVHAPLALVAVLATSTSSCAFLSGRLPCSKDADCLSGDVCADDGYCGPGRTANGGEGEGANGGEGEGEGAAGNRVRHVTTSIQSLVSAGVGLESNFKLHVVPFGGALCTQADDCDPDECDVTWSANSELIVGDTDGSEGVSNLGGLDVVLVVEADVSSGTIDASVFGDGGALGQVGINAGTKFTQVAYHSGGQVIVCDANAGGDNRCQAGFTTTACP